MGYPEFEEAFEDHHRHRTSNIWRRETLTTVSGSHWDDDHLHAFRVLLKDNREQLPPLADVYDEAAQRVNDTACALLQQLSYSKLRATDPVDLRDLGLACGFYRALLHVMLRVPPEADSDRSLAMSRLRRDVKPPQNPGFSNLSDDDFESMIANQEVGLPGLADSGGSAPRSLRDFLASSDTSGEPDPSALPRGQKRPHPSSSSAHGSVFSQSGASSEKSAHDEKAKHEGVTVHLALNFVQLVAACTAQKSDTARFEFTPHQEPFDSCFGYFAWSCINDGSAYILGPVKGRWDIANPLVLVSFEMKSLAIDDPNGQGLRAKTVSERLGQHVSELLGMLHQRLNGLGITSGADNLEAMIATLPEHVRT